MMGWLKRVRGALGMGLTWGVAWTPVGTLLAGVLMVIGLDPPGALLNITGMFGALGFLGGTIFSGILGLAEGRRSFHELSLPRFTAWGGVGGLLLGGLTGMALLGGPGIHLLDAVVASVTTLLGAGSAAATLALARKAEDDSIAVTGGDIGEVGLTAKEKARLLGDAG